MLDVRVYRAAFLPALIALFVAAFSLADRPSPATSALAADAFDAARAYGGASPLQNSLLELGESFPHRRPGSADDAALADRVAATLADRDEAGRPAFRVTRQTVGQVETVVGVRPGLSSRRIVVLSHRDARGSPGLAQLSGTAAMLELARLFRARDLRKTLVLVSTSGATEGFTGARAWAERAAATPIDAVLVLGDMASVQIAKPWVVPFSLGSGPVPLTLLRTVESAVRAEVGSRPGGSRASAQWARRALPATVSEQGVVAEAGLPAVLLSASGERGPAADAEVKRGRIEVFGRAALRAVSAIDAAGPASDERAAENPPFASGPAGIVTMRNVLPDWAVRLLTGTLLLPALLTAVDGVFRVRRRRLPLGPWVAWLAAVAAPVLAAWLWLRALALAGALEPPAAPVLPVPPVGTPEAVALASVLLVMALVLYLARTRVPARGSAAAGSLGAATGAAICGAAALVWVFNPYAAALLLPAAHLWLFAASPHTRLRGWAGFVALLAGLVAPALVALHYAQALRIDPLELAWTGALAAASGQLSILVAAVAAVLVACVAALALVIRTRRRVEAQAPPEPLRTRGPASYAGPGSLGGTESALKR